MAEPSIYWPAGLPQTPQRASYARAVGNNTTRTSMDYGPAKTRRRSSAQPTVLSAAYMLFESKIDADTGDNVDQKKLFLDFFEVVDCQMSFWLPDPEDLTRYILAKIRASSDEQGFTLSYAGPGLWSVALTLEVHPLVPYKQR